MKYPLLKRLLIAAALAATSMSAAVAAPPEQDYLAARDAYIKAQGHDETDRGWERHAAALADLETQLRRIVGPTALKGFPAEGKIHLDTLFTDDEGFGLLDGLVYAIPLDETGIDDKVSVVVTTKGLFEAWLRAHKTKWWNRTRLPQDLPTALRSDDFYQQALSTDSAVVTFAQIPVIKPAWASVAYGVLAVRTQDAAGETPTEMDIVVIGAERVYVVTAKTEVTVGPVAACANIRQQFKARAAAAQAAYEKSGSKNVALLEKSTKLEDDGDRAYLRCYPAHVRAEESFAAAIRQAQALIDLLPGK